MEENQNRDPSPPSRRSIPPTNRATATRAFGRREAIVRPAAPAPVPSRPRPGSAPGEAREARRPATARPVREVPAIRGRSPRTREVPGPPARPPAQPRSEPPPAPRRPAPPPRGPAPRTPRRRAASPAPRGLALDPEMPNPDREPEIPLDRLDRDAVKVVARLRAVGHQAYLVGGCVRDLLLGRTPKDFDVATDAHPGEVRAIFRNCRLIGRRFRLAHVFFRGGKIIEVATFRPNPADVGRRRRRADDDLLITHDNVFGTAEEDARRRDFTINGLFYDVAGARSSTTSAAAPTSRPAASATIGDPEIRLREDPVRILRAIRFAARLDFTIEPEVFAAMGRAPASCPAAPRPRVLEETFKILRCTGASRAFELLRSAGLLPVMLPSLSQALDAGGPEARARFQAHLVRPRRDGPLRRRGLRRDAARRAARAPPDRAGRRTRGRPPPRRARPDRTAAAQHGGALPHGDAGAEALPRTAAPPPPRRARRPGLLHRCPPAPPGDREGHRAGCRGALALGRRGAAEGRRGAEEHRALAARRGSRRRGPRVAPAADVQRGPRRRDRPRRRGPPPPREGRRRRRRGRGAAASPTPRPQPRPGPPRPRYPFRVQCASQSDPP